VSLAIRNRKSFIYHENHLVRKNAKCADQFYYANPMIMISQIIRNPIVSIRFIFISLFIV